MRWSAGVTAHLSKGVAVVRSDPVIVGRPRKQNPLRMILMEVDIQDPRQISIHPLSQAQCPYAKCTVKSFSFQLSTLSFAFLKTTHLIAIYQLAINGHVRWNEL